jgi:uncharacterized protein (TIGR03437 family)
MLFRIPGPGGSTITPLFLEGGISTGLSIGEVRYFPDARPAPSFTTESFVDAAAYAGRPSPGGLAALFGTFPTGLEVAGAIPLPRILGDAVQVRFRVESAGAAAPAAASGGNQQGAIVELPAPLMFVSGGQINLQVPWEVDPSAGNVTAIVSVNGVDSNAIALPVGPVSPGIFSFDFGPGRAVAFNNADGTIAQPVGSVAGVTCRPTVPGEALVILASGLGPTNPPGVTGQNSLDIGGNFVRRDTLALPRVLIGGVQADLLFSGLSPEFVGVVQINVTVPAGIAPGNAVPLVLEVNGQRTREDVTIAVGAPAN